VPPARPLYNIKLLNPHVSLDPHSLCGPFTATRLNHCQPTTAQQASIHTLVPQEASSAQAGFWKTLQCHLPQQPFSIACLVLHPPPPVKRFKGHVVLFRFHKKTRDAKLHVFPELQVRVPEVSSDYVFSASQSTCTYQDAFNYTPLRSSATLLLHAPSLPCRLAAVAHALPSFVIIPLLRLLLLRLWTLMVRFMFRVSHVALQHPAPISCDGDNVALILRHLPVPPSLVRPMPAPRDGTRSRCLSRYDEHQFASSPAISVPCRLGGHDRCPTNKQYG
jgi:hypothetical protein